MGWKVDRKEVTGHNECDLPFLILPTSTLTPKHAMSTEFSKLQEYQAVLEIELAEQARNPRMVFERDLLLKLVRHYVNQTPNQFKVGQRGFVNKAHRNQLAPSRYIRKANFLIVEALGSGRPVPWSDLQALESIRGTESGISDAAILAGTTSRKIKLPGTVTSPISVRE